MISYDTAKNIPPREKLLIIDAIDYRDNIIDNAVNALADIELKYKAVIEENEKLKQTMSSNSLYQNQNQYQYNIDNMNHISNRSHIISNVTNPPKIILTESTIKGNEICKSFVNRDYLLDNSSIDDGYYRKTFDDINEIIKKKKKKNTDRY